MYNDTTQTRIPYIYKYNRKEIHKLTIFLSQLTSGFTNTVDGDVENFVLSFDSIALTDIGTYTCEATYNNAAGDDAKVSF